MNVPFLFLLPPFPIPRTLPYLRAATLFVSSGSHHQVSPPSLPLAGKTCDTLPPHIPPTRYPPPCTAGGALAVPPAHTICCHRRFSAVQGPSLYSRGTPSTITQILNLQTLTMVRRLAISRRKKKLLDGLDQIRFASGDGWLLEVPTSTSAHTITLFG